MGFPVMLVGYMRVSSESDRQTTNLQRDALLAAGIDARNLFEDHASGAKDDRAGLAKAMAYVCPGDVLVVWKLDRLGRLRISAIAIACFGIIRSLLFLTYSFTLTDRNPLFFSLIHPLIRSDGCCEPIDPVTHPLPLDFRSCCTIH